MAELLLGVRPIGDWLISITLSKCFAPRISVCLPTGCEARLSAFASAGYKMRLINGRVYVHISYIIKEMGKAVDVDKNFNVRIAG